jgi:CheY-like chemotaxis protein
MSTSNGKHESGGSFRRPPSTDAPLNRMIVPLTVTFANVQLLRRRIEREQEIGRHELRAAIDQIETATRAIVDEFRAFELSTSSPAPWENPENMDGRDNDPLRGDTGHMTRESTKDEGGRATTEQMSRKHVFVVNGSPEFLDIVRQLLQDENYNVTTTNFVPLSFDTIAAAQPSMLIIDLVIGEQAGWDLLSRLRSEVSTKEIPVLLVSTRPALLKEAQERHEKFGGDRYLTKPFDLDDLLDNIEQLIGKA